MPRHCTTRTWIPPVQASVRGRLQTSPLVHSVNLTRTAARGGRLRRRRMDPARLRLRAGARLPAWRAVVLRPGELVGAGGEAKTKSSVGLGPLQAPTRRFAPTSPASGEVKPALHRRRE